MKEIKFRQPIWSDGQFHEWHYWGFLKTGEFNAPCYHPEKSKLESQQFTGLYDNNGKEIYGGDVVKTGRSTFRVFWENAQFKAWDLLTKRWAYSPENLYAIGNQYEIIGNIHENPEFSESLVKEIQNKTP